MVYKRFSTGLIIRISLIVLIAFMEVICVRYLALYHFRPLSWWVTCIFFLLLLTVTTINLYHFTNSANRKLSFFFDSIRSNDFSIHFRSDDKLGDSFRELNRKFLDVQDAFKSVRAENEAGLHLLQTLVSHIQTGLLVADEFGRIEIVNNAACTLLGYYRLKNLQELTRSHPGLAEIIRQPDAPGTPQIYLTDKNQELSVTVIPVIIREHPKTLVTIQNISGELQQKESEAWQNLTRVLRHEIMNSLTPVLSLIGTMKMIVLQELADTPENSQVRKDLLEALDTIDVRGHGMIHFVEGYRNYSNIPAPRMVVLAVQPFIQRLVTLLQPDIDKAGIQFSCQLPLKEIYIRADAEQLSRVLINIVKNAREALVKTTAPAITIEVSQRRDQVTISVSDNGPGIEEEALKDIFIPFYSTKKDGVGIGLSLSRQIIQQHGAILRALSESGKGSEFQLLFPASYAQVATATEEN